MGRAELMKLSRDARRKAIAAANKMFKEEWATQASEGKCDEINGAEFVRCLMRWISEDRPGDIRAFITRNAK